jgi:hypothetical protein
MLSRIARGLFSTTKEGHAAELIVKMRDLRQHIQAEEQEIAGLKLKVGRVRCR